jgi:hypothetical protein
MSVYSHREISPKSNIEPVFVGHKIAKQVENRGQRCGVNADFAPILANALEIPSTKTVLKGKVLMDIAEQHFSSRSLI